MTLLPYQEEAGQREPSEIWVGTGEAWSFGAATGSCCVRARATGFPMVDVLCTGVRETSIGPQIPVQCAVLIPRLGPFHGESRKHRCSTICSAGSDFWSRGLFFWTRSEQAFPNAWQWNSGTGWLSGHNSKQWPWQWVVSPPLPAQDVEKEQSAVHKEHKQSRMTGGGHEIVFFAFASYFGFIQLHIECLKGNYRY